MRRSVVAVVLVSASLIRDDAFARRGGGGFRGRRLSRRWRPWVACGPDVPTAAATGVAWVRLIPSRVAQGVPDIRLPVVPVVRVTQSLVAPSDSSLPGRVFPIWRIWHCSGAAKSFALHPNLLLGVPRFPAKSPIRPSGQSASKQLAWAQCCTRSPPVRVEKRPLWSSGNADPCPLFSAACPKSEPVDAGLCATRTLAPHSVEPSAASFNRRLRLGVAILALSMRRCLPKIPRR